MFTGLVEAVGEVIALDPAPSGLALRLRTTLVPEIEIGESLAVSGVCLTITATGDGEVGAAIGPETARVTTFGSMRPPTGVNLERALRADGRFGGHIVQGHVDGTGVVHEVWVEGDAHWLTIAFPMDMAVGLIRKGSIAVDGVSLTVADLRESEFDVMIIPHTWAQTTFSVRRPGDRVNLELDIIGKYAARIAELAVVDRLRAMKR